MKKAKIMISQQRYHDLVSRVINYVDNQVTAENLSPIDRCNLCYCLLRDVFEGYVKAIEGRGIKFVEEEEND